MRMSAFIVDDIPDKPNICGISTAKLGGGMCPGFIQDGNVLIFEVLKA